MILELKNKQGFKTNDRLIIINDNNGLFYYKENKNKEVVHFNLPEGKYSTDNKLYLTELRKYKLKPLPLRNVFIKKPNELKFIFCDNPNKCTIDLKKGLIYFDNQFKNEKTFIKDFVLNHELGHYRYLNEGQKSELNADSYAYNKMINIGYNPSQIAVANFYVLSNKKNSIERKKEIYKQTKNSY